MAKFEVYEKIEIVDSKNFNSGSPNMVTNGVSVPIGIWWGGVLLIKGLEKHFYSSMVLFDKYFMKHTPTGINLRAIDAGGGLTTAEVLIKIDATCTHISFWVKGEVENGLWHSLRNLAFPIGLGLLSWHESSANPYGWLVVAGISVIWVARTTWSYLTHGKRCKRHFEEAIKDVQRQLEFSADK